MTAGVQQYRTRRTASAIRAGRDVDSWPWHAGQG